MALTCAYADGLPEVTPEAMESAIKELQWPSYAERVERHHRERTPSVPSEEGMLEVLREQSRTLAVIAGQAGKMELLAPALESIRRSLAAIEIHLRNLTQKPGQKPGADLRVEPTVDRRKKTG
jgi:hypothetical protein